MLYISIPVYNEAPTIGVLLWRIRKVFQEYSLEYEIVVYDDASTDSTAETLAPYVEVLPLTIQRGEKRIGYAGALEALARTVSARTRYPRRDAMILMQGDFTDQPEHIPELVKRFEGGADIVLADRPVDGPDTDPVSVRRLRRIAPWVLRPFIATPQVRDPFRAFRLIRITILRELLKTRGTTPVFEGSGWATNVDLLLKAAPHARRIETVDLGARYDVRSRESRVRPLADAMALYRFGRAAKRQPAK